MGSCLWIRRSCLAGLGTDRQTDTDISSVIVVVIVVVESFY
jgi:hypothetical protein